MVKRAVGNGLDIELKAHGGNWITMGHPGGVNTCLCIFGNTNKAGTLGNLLNICSHFIN